MVYKAPHKRGDILLLAAFHRILVEEVRAVCNAQRPLSLRTGRIDASSGVVGVPSKDSLLLQDYDAEIPSRCRLNGSGEPRSAGSYDNDVAVPVPVGRLPGITLPQGRTDGHIDGLNHAVTGKGCP